MKRGIRKTLFALWVAGLLLWGLVSGAPAWATTITLLDIDSGLTSPTGDYRWLDVANQVYSASYIGSYDYTQAFVQVEYDVVGNILQGTLTATTLKPNFAYQLKLGGTSGQPGNEQIGLAGRWWQETWNGLAWVGSNLNNQVTSAVYPALNPNDVEYESHKDDPNYRYTGYMVFDYFITDENGNATLTFSTDSSYHVLWKAPEAGDVGDRNPSANDGPLKSSTFDADNSTAYADTGDDFTVQTVSIFGEWERLYVGDIYLQPGYYDAQIFLTEESFHGSGGTNAGNWAAAMGGGIEFAIPDPSAVFLLGSACLLAGLALRRRKPNQ